MVSAGWSATGRESILGIAGRWFARRRREVVSVVAIAVRFVLVAAGLSLLTAAAWTLALPAGLAVAGVSCLVLEWVVKRR